MPPPLGITIVCRAKKPADLTTFVREVEHFAMSDYLRALTIGGSLSLVAPKSTAIGRLVVFVQPAPR